MKRTCKFLAFFSLLLQVAVVGVVTAQPIQVEKMVHEWRVQNNEATLNFVGESSLFSINFSLAQEANCEPLHGLLAIKGRELGRLLKRSVVKNDRNKWVLATAGERYTGRTATAQYANGMEVQMVVEEGFLNFSRPSAVESLKKNQPITAGFGSKPLISKIEHRGFAAAYRRLKQNCRT